jgi:hypothetical protein
MRSALAGYQMCVEQVMLQSLVVSALVTEAGGIKLRCNENVIVITDTFVLNSPPPTRRCQKAPARHGTSPSR